MKIAALDNGARRQVVALFGAGLIGGAVLNELRKRRRCDLLDLPFSWTHAQAQPDELQTIMAHILKAAENSGERSSIDIVWSAGKGGFSAPQAVFDAETKTLARVLEAFRRGACESPQRFRYHLFSSAGGLFEGRRLVREGDEPSPLRPYAVAKLRQEHMLTQQRDAMATVIYRPSSVYGYNGPGDRQGLITALLNAAYQRRPALVFGRPASLRDFILNDDIARFVANVILAEQPVEHAVFNLVSGAPSSISHIIREVETVTRLTVPRSYVWRADNSSDNTFHPSIAPKGLTITPLREGIGAVSRRLHRLSIQSPHAP